MQRHNKRIAISLLLLLATTVGASAHEADPDGMVDHPVAILPFRERGEEVKEMGGQASDLLFAKLVTDPALWLVDRDDLEKTIAEQELNLSGVVDPAEAVQIGQITGAKILVTGSVFQVGKSLYVVAKVIGTETTRVLGASAKGSLGDGLDGVMADLSSELASMIKNSSSKLVAAPVAPADRVEALQEKLGDAKRPVVLIRIEERHVGQVQFDPAAESEFLFLAKETGFQVIDSHQGSVKQAEVLITGEGLSEFATRRGELISVKARLEVRAIERATGRVLAADRQTRVAVDLTEQIAAKDALQKAAADVAERLLPRLVQREAAE